MESGLKFIYGVALNDSSRPATTTIDGKRIKCPIYTTWHHMLERCFSEKWHEKYPSYRDCSCIEDWLKLSKFEKWMLTQDWEGKQLDKDFLSVGTKIYSPETCIFIDQGLNKFLTDRKSQRGEYPLGVSKCSTDDGFVAGCWNPFEKSREYLGYFTCPNEAHLAWKKRKHELACIYANQQTDPRVAEALRVRYL